MKEEILKISNALAQVLPPPDLVSLMAEEKLISGKNCPELKIKRLFKHRLCWERSRRTQGLKMFISV